MKNIRITIVIFLILIAIFVSLAVRCFYLQYYRNYYYESASQKQQRVKFTQLPRRGPILDIKGRLLAASNKNYIVKAEPRIIKNPAQVALELAPLIDMDSEEIRSRITDTDNPGYARMKVVTDANICDKVLKIQGVGVDSFWQRYYPIGSVTSHIVGFMSKDGRSLGGIEHQYDNVLSGTTGQDIFWADKFRRTIRLKQQESVVKNGSGLILTIDATIQQFVRAALYKRYTEYNAEAATAVVMDPKSGEILAMVSLPDFDPEDTGNSDPNNFRNRAITDTFEPGSIMKPITMTIALDAGVLSYNDHIFCENGLYSGKGFGSIKEYDYHKYGNLPIREIIIKSSNIGSAKIGQKLGKKRLYEGLKLFGFGAKTGIDCPGEDSGVLWPVNTWTGYSVTRIPFGHEITVTALQVLKAFAILANGGRAVKPYLVKAIVDEQGNIIQVKQPSVQFAHVIKPEVAKWMVTNPLTGVVNEKDKGGTGWRAKLDKWQVFGKTGTANIALKDRKGFSQTDYIASFIAGAPAEDPRIVVLVSIRKPDRSLGKGYTGGAVASPVVKQIIEKTLTYLESSH